MGFRLYGRTESNTTIPGRSHQGGVRASIPDPSRWEDPLQEESIATHSSILAWRIPWIPRDQHLVQLQVGKLRPGGEGVGNRSRTRRWLLEWP